MVDYVEQGWETSIVEEPALGVCPQSSQRSRPIAMVWSPVGLEVVDADLATLMQVPARLRPSWLGVAAGAVGLPAEQLVTAFGRVLIEAAMRRSWGGNRQLVEM